jgi:hypothetical protein
MLGISQQDGGQKFYFLYMKSTLTHYSPMVTICPTFFNALTTLHFTCRIVYLWVPYDSQKKIAIISLNSTNHSL